MAHVILAEQTLNQLCRKWNRNITSISKQGDDVPHGLGPLVPNCEERPSARDELYYLHEKP
jgi:hypothetical protein